MIFVLSGLPGGRLGGLLGRLGGLLRAFWAVLDHLEAIFGAYHLGHDFQIWASATNFSRQKNPPTLSKTAGFLLPLCIFVIDRICDY